MALLLSLLVIPTLTQVQFPLDQVSDQLGKQMLSTVGPQLIESKGRYTPQVRTAFLDWSWQEILKALRAKSIAIPSETIANVEGNPDIKLAMAGSVWPPDPSILQNYATLRTHVGPERARKYESLLAGLAVARRVQGFTTATNGEVGRENQVAIWAYSPLNRASNERDRQFVAQIAKFLQSRNRSAIDCFEDANLQNDLKGYLRAAGVAQNFVDEVARTPGFGERLKNAMIVLGQRPANRSPRPPFLDWVDHLLKTYESTPKAVPQWEGQTVEWPLFPIDKAPWPLLMPLSYEVPLDEAKQLWRNYQGLDGNPTFHVYGPYRDDLTAMPDQLRPSKWFWNAVLDMNIHGGQCMPLSLATIDLYSSLGRPAMGAAQPDHANLISFGYDQGVWKSDVEQDFAGGPRVTYAAWYFTDPVRHDMRYRDLFGWPTSEFQLGLTAGMNLGLESYIDTRIAARIYDLLPGASRISLGFPLLRSVTAENPFNPETWYRLAHDGQDPVKGIMLLEAARSRDMHRLGEPGGSPKWEAFQASGKTDRARGCIDAYWSVLAEYVGRFALIDHPAPQEEAVMGRGLNELSQTPNISAEELLRYCLRRVNYPSEAFRKAEVGSNQALADKDDRFGLLRMGQRYLYGDGVPRDETKARQLLKRAAQKGDPISAVMLPRLDEPVSMEGVQVTASNTYSPTQDVHHLVDGSGMFGSIHDNSVPAATMWHTADNPTASSPGPGLPEYRAWVKFAFPQPRRFDSLQIWNHNQASLTDRGFRHVSVFGTTDGTHWEPLVEDIEVPRANGDRQTSFDLTAPKFNRPYRGVILAAKDNYGGVTFGLSEVRFVTFPDSQEVPSFQIEARASSQYNSATSPDRLIDGSGMDGETHDNNPGAITMWHTVVHPEASRPDPNLPPSRAWVRFNFTTPQVLESVRIWNFNQAVWTQRGFRRLRIWGTTDGKSWFSLTKPEVVQLPKASGTGGVAGTTFFLTSGNKALQSVVLLPEAEEGSYGDTETEVFGLSEVRFYRPGSRVRQ